MAITESISRPVRNGKKDTNLHMIEYDDDYKLQPLSKAKNLYQLLRAAAATCSGIATYPSGSPFSGVYTAYKDLLQEAESNARLIQGLHGISSDSVVLLHFDEHLDNLRWFWAVTVAGYLPAISIPLTNHMDQRKRHIRNLQKVLHNPIILAPHRLVSDFVGIDGLNVQPVESLNLVPSNSTAFLEAMNKSGEETAVLMLTSGSTGLSKAVCVRHQQMFDSVYGKSRFHGLKKDDVFLNWIGLDHVANLLETHIHAMGLGAEQVHVHASDVIADPDIFLRLLEKHHVAHTFAPNFFLALLSKRLEGLEHEPKHNRHFDLSHLRVIISGGEANVVETCTRLTEQLHSFQVAHEVIKPGFGMTETCAGSVYAVACPSCDLAQENRFASLGTCMQGLEMRILTDQSMETAPYEVGSLQLRGSVVFDKYYNNEIATKAAFTNDGWFITGDRALLDSNANLNIVGRTKDFIIMNGIHHSLAELEASMEQIAGVAPSYTAVFPYWPLGAQTEQLCVVYCPDYDQESSRARVETADAITRVSGMLTGTKPYQIIPVPKISIEKSSLGKISRAKIRQLYENGDFEHNALEDEKVIRTYRIATCKKPSNNIERSILAVLSDMLGFAEDQVGVDISIFDLGMTSLHLLAFKRRLQNMPKLSLGKDIPLTTLLISPTIQGIANGISCRSQPRLYSPVVPLQKKGSKAPLWLVHPASGDILDFVTLSQQIPDRPVYGLRTRGLNAGETFFSEIRDIANAYFDHITQEQPGGPYAIAGYSLGSTVAFEIAKLLEQTGKEVRFLGLIDSPPHPKPLVKGLKSNQIILNVAYFTGMISEDDIVPTDQSRQDLFDYIFAKAPKKRLLELDMDREKFSVACNVYNAFDDVIKRYDPEGTVGSADVFWCTPLKAIAGTRGEWMDEHMRHWDEFIRGRIGWHECEGSHATILNKKFVGGFARKLRDALEERGL